MVRAALWTIGLFSLAMVVCYAFPAPWLEPLALVVLGVVMLWASARTGPRPRRARAEQPKEVAA